MPLSAGERLGPYEILAPIGAGGMGEVYRARDTRLDRDVAIKVLPAPVAQHPERLARFEREAKVLAALNHPNIATIHGLEDQAIVMELVEGPTLADRLAAGAIPLDESLRISAQIAEALEAAHEKGVVHRDLKPANVKVREDGTVKVLDFGLATAVQSGAREAGASVNSPTLTMGATEAGVILGTAAYMAPEQAAGALVDRRADIWSFGVVLWEMLTGHRLFDADSMAHTLADVLRKEIPFDRAPAPPPIKDLLRRCLDRDVKTRLQAIGEARIAIARYLVHPESGAESPALARARPISKLPWIAAAVAAAAALALGYVSYRHASEDPPPPMKLSILPPDKGSFAGNSIPVISPDGRRVVFGANAAGKTAIWVRDLDALTARILPGTEEGQYPFWSPDSRTVAFFQGSKLKRMDIAGGPSVSLCDSPGGGRGGAWAGDRIVFGVAGTGVMYQVSAAGGAPTAVIKPDAAAGETLLRWPSFLPDGRHFLYSSNNSDPEKVAIEVADLASGAHQRVLGASSNAVYVSPLGTTQGHLLFARDQTLMAQPFDANKLQISGDALPIAEDVGIGVNSLQHQFSASRNGALVFKSGDSMDDLQLTWFDASGKPLGTLASRINSFGVISPDGSTVVFDRRDPQTARMDIWLYDLMRGTTSRFTFGPNYNFNPVWSGDGRSIAFASNRDGTARVFQRATNAGADQILTPPLGDTPQTTRPQDWSRDGRYVIEETINRKGGFDLWLQPLFGDKKPFPYLATPFNETNARISPDGKWLAYVSDETRRYEVYVQPFPTPGAKAQISTEGGEKPVWSRDGKQLYFISADRKMMAVNVTTGEKFEAGSPRMLFETRIGNALGNRFDVSKEGRFLIPTETEQANDSPLTLIVNWPALLKK
jgi:serine/threonine protein kinase/Tol biopolymer transport system component